MDTIKNSVSQSAEALLLVSDGRGTLGHGREGLYLTFPRILAFDPLAGICLSDRHFLFLKVCVCVFEICASMYKHADTCISILGLASCAQHMSPSRSSLLCSVVVVDVHMHRMRPCEFFCAADNVHAHGKAVQSEGDSGSDTGE